EIILEYFEKNKVPSNVDKIRRYVSQKLNQEVSWNTVKKYLEELVKLDKLKKIILPHSKEKDKEGLTLYEPK
ncbi:MAG: hypothetical protein QXQ14_01680, partial [Candidatus Aenigmatarchaeota archaeon]